MSSRLPSMFLGRLLVPRLRRPSRRSRGFERIGGFFPGALPAPAVEIATRATATMSDTRRRRRRGINRTIGCPYGFFTPFSRMPPGNRAM